MPSNGYGSPQGGLRKGVKSYDSSGLRQGHGRSLHEVRQRGRQGHRDPQQRDSIPIPSAIEDSIAASKAILGSKSVHEAFELQTDFAKSAFESYVSELTKFGEILSPRPPRTPSRRCRAVFRPGWKSCRAPAPPKSRSAASPTPTITERARGASLRAFSFGPLGRWTAMGMRRPEMPITFCIGNLPNAPDMR